MLPFDGGALYEQAAVEPHDCAGPAVSDVTMFGSLSCPGKPHSHTLAFALRAMADANRPYGLICRAHCEACAGPPAGRRDVEDAGDRAESWTRRNGGAARGGT